LLEKGSGYADAAQIGGALTSRQLKVKQKSNNLAGLQLADLVAHPSRNEILSEHGHSVTIAPFAAKVIAFLLYQETAPSAYMRKTGGQSYFGRLAPLLLRQASSSEPRGMVRL
jgi:hypothetical protein